MVVLLFYILGETAFRATVSHACDGDHALEVENY